MIKPENYFERKEREEEKPGSVPKGAMGPLKCQSGETLLDSYRLEPLRVTEKAFAIALLN